MLVLIQNIEENNIKQHQYKDLSCNCIVIGQHIRLRNQESQIRVGGAERELRELKKTIEGQGKSLENQKKALEAQRLSAQRKLEEQNQAAQRRLSEQKRSFEGELTRLQRENRELQRRLEQRSGT